MLPQSMLVCIFSLCLGGAAAFDSDVTALMQQRIQAHENEPKEFRVLINRPGSIGLDVDKASSLKLDSDASDTNLVVSQVREGLVNKWNQWHPDQAIAAGDTIVEVNGVKDEVRDMLKEFSKADSLDILVRKTGTPEAAVAAKKRVLQEAKSERAESTEQTQTEQKVSIAARAANAASAAAAAAAKAAALGAGVVEQRMKASAEKRVEAKEEAAAAEQAMSPHETFNAHLKRFQWAHRVTENAKLDAEELSHKTEDAVEARKLHAMEVNEKAFADRSWSKVKIQHADNSGNSQEVKKLIEQALESREGLMKKIIEDWAKSDGTIADLRTRVDAAKGALKDTNDESIDRLSHALDLDALKRPEEEEQAVAAATVKPQSEMSRAEIGAQIAKEVMGLSKLPTVAKNLEDRLRGMDHKAAQVKSEVNLRDSEKPYGFDGSDADWEAWHADPANQQKLEEAKAAKMQLQQNEDMRSEETRARGHAIDQQKEVIERLQEETRQQDEERNAQKTAMDQKESMKVESKLKREEREHAEQKHAAAKAYAKKNEEKAAAVALKKEKMAETKKAFLVKQAAEKKAAEEQMKQARETGHKVMKEKLNVKEAKLLADGKAAKAAREAVQDPIAAAAKVAAKEAKNKALAEGKAERNRKNQEHIAAKKAEVEAAKAAAKKEAESPLKNIKKDPRMQGEKDD